MKMFLYCMGVLIMDMFPSEHGKHLADVSSYRPVPGGAPANVAVAVCRLGGNSAYLGAVGDDAFGEAVVECLKGCGVDVSGIRTDDERRTTLNFHAKPTEDSIEFLFYRNPGADTNLTIKDIDIKALVRANALHLDSMCLTDEPMRSAAAYAADFVRQCGGIVSFDCNWRPPVWASPNTCRKAVFGFLPRADIFKANDDEIALLCPGMEMDEAVQTLMQMGPKAVVVTMGSNGSRAYTNRFCVQQAGMKVNLADSIGCGDAYIAGFLYKLFEKKLNLDTMTSEDAADCALFADCVAALTATKHGALSALPQADEVEKLYLSRKV
jgi:fructokinase